MEKLNLTEQQGEQIAALRDEGLALRLEVEARRIAWEAAEQREKTVEQAAIMEKVFTYADDYEDENGNRKGERITDPADARGRIKVFAAIHEPIWRPRARYADCGRRERNGSYLPRECQSKRRLRSRA